MKLARSRFWAIAHFATKQTDTIYRQGIEYPFVFVYNKIKVINPFFKELMMNVQQLNEFITSNYPTMLQTLRELCAIPAPSHLEQARAEYCRAWLESVGARGVYIDDVLNAIELILEKKYGRG